MSIDYNGSYLVGLKLKDLVDSCETGQLTRTSVDNLGTVSD